MGNVKDLNVKNQKYYHFDDMIDIRKSESNLLKIDKKSYRDFDIYHIGYLTVKKFSNWNSDCDYEYIRSINPLYLIFKSATGYFKEEYVEKYLILNCNKKYEEVLSEIKSKIITINDAKELFYEKDYVKTSVNTDDDVPMNKY